MTALDWFFVAYPLTVAAIVRFIWACSPRRDGDWSE